MPRRLNGWQRLWVLVAVLYMIPVIVIAASVFPQQSDLVATRVYDTIRAVGEYQNENDKGFQFEGAYAVRTKYYSDLSDDEIIKRLHEKWSGKVDFSKIETEYRQKVKTLPTERAKAIGVAFIFWFIPVVFVYALGIAIAWVIRGFRREKS